MALSFIKQCHLFTSNYIILQNTESSGGVNVEAQSSGGANVEVQSSGGNANACIGATKKMSHSTKNDQGQAPARENEGSSSSKTYTWKEKSVTSLRKHETAKRVRKSNTGQASGK